MEFDNKDDDDKDDDGSGNKPLTQKSACYIVPMPPDCWWGAILRASRHAASRLTGPEPEVESLNMSTYPSIGTQLSSAWAGRACSPESPRAWYPLHDAAKPSCPRGWYRNFEVVLGRLVLWVERGSLEVSIR